MDNVSNNIYNNYYKNELQNIIGRQNFVICSVNKKFEKLIQLIISETNNNIFTVNSVEQLLKQINKYNKPLSDSKVNKNIIFIIENTEPFKKVKNVMLSEREKEILSNLVLGKQYKQIAETLFISVHTVRYHIKNIYKKFNIHSQSEAVNLALKMGLI